MFEKTYYQIEYRNIEFNSTYHQSFVKFKDLETPLQIAEKAADDRYS